ncbi:MAG TPA: hypothetical protein VGL81_01310 [Polyangiaceae bacterium]|jgi:hypothetical protein
MRASCLVIALASLVPLAASGCATYHDDLARGERAYEASEDERALAIFRSLETDTNRLTDTERAHYSYLRGMTDYRIGYKAEARHWLSVAAALEQQTPDSLPAEWKKRMSESLKEMNEEVYTAGIESLSNAGAAKAKASDDDSSGSDSDSHADPDAPKKGNPKPAKTDDD